MRAPRAADHLRGGATGGRKPFAIVAGLVQLLCVHALRRLAPEASGPAGGPPTRYRDSGSLPRRRDAALPEGGGDRPAAVSSVDAKAGRRPRRRASARASLGLVFVPCAGPVLAAITVVGATQEVGARSIVLTLSYAIGAAVPMLFVAFGGRSAMNTLRPHAHRIRQGLGVAVGLTALAIALNVDRHFQTAIPGYTEALQSRWRSDRAQRELRRPARCAGRELLAARLRQARRSPVSRAGSTATC